MSMRVLRLVLLVALFAVMSIHVLPHTGVVRADGGTCQSSGVGTAYRYSDGAPLFSTSFSLGPAAYDAYENCLSDSQGQAIFVCRASCAFGGAYGQHGVAYCRVDWSVYWDGDFQGNPVQQYDCGDV